MTGTQARGPATRAALVDAARTVFVRRGYDAAGIAEVVALAHSSVGSLYHHFDGKSDLWLEVYREHQLALQHRVSAAIAVANTGSRDAFELFLIGSRAYLDACWEHRTLVALFAAGDHPPGYGREVRRQLEHWTTTNHAYLKAMPVPLSRTLVLVLTTLAQTAGIEVAREGTPARADAVAEEFLGIMRRLYPGRGATPAGR